MLRSTACLFIVVLIHVTEPPPTGASKSNPLAGFGPITSLPAHLYRPTRTTTTPHCKTALPFCGVSIYDFCLWPMRGSGIPMGASRQFWFPHMSQHHTPNLNFRSFSTLLVNDICSPSSVVDYGYELLSPMQYPSTYFLVTCIPNHIIGNVNTATMTTMTPFPHIYYHALIHALIRLHSNTHPRYLPLVIPHTTVGAANYSAPSSIHDGALTILVQPSCDMWHKLMLHKTFFPCYLPLTLLNSLDLCLCSLHML
jgi:hypothetical protein